MLALPHTPVMRAPIARAICTALEPTPPEFQLAGDTERVALTAAAIGVDLEDLELPVPLDRRAYRAAVRLLTERGIIAGGRLTDYGRDVEAMPVERPWGELLVHADPHVLPFVAVSASVESLHRMTRDERDLHGLTVHGSDHLSAYNVYAEAVNTYGYVGLVYGLPRHLFSDEMEAWAEERGVLVKAIEDLALGTASVYRTLERPLPKRLPRADGAVLRQYRDLLARIMPLDLVIDGALASGESARVSRDSMCSAMGAVAGNVRYFADRHGVPRAAIEGTNIPLDLIRRYAHRGPPAVELRDGRRPGLTVVRRTEYAGFELDGQRTPLVGPFPAELADAARDALAGALIESRTPHADQQVVQRAADRLAEYWRRSGGRLREATREHVLRLLREQLDGVKSWDQFLATPLVLDLTDLLPEAAREALDAGVQDFVAERDLGGEALRLTLRYALDQRRLREELDRRTFIDELTGLYNANGFEQIAVHHLRLADRTEEPLVLVFVRIDDLAAVGQTYGAAEGPRLLADTARILRASVRESDIVARVGPDAFCALLTGNATGAETLILARMVEAVATHNARGGRPYPLALSVGAARYDPMHPMGLSELIREADAQMRRRSTPIR